MNLKRNPRMFVPFLPLAILLLASLACSSTITPPASGISPDDRFQAQLTSTSNNINSAYEVIEIKTGNLVLTTYSQYPESRNNVKAAKFSDDSKKFAVAYHYSHNGDYTWVGVWSTETGEFLYSGEIRGFTTNLNRIFDN
jgi:hypothetical protein